MEITEGLNQDHAQLPTPPATANSEQQVASGSSLGSNLHCKGDISAREDVFIDGKVEGTIALKMNKLEVGPSGYIQANIFAKIIVVSGEVLGDLYASDQVIVTKTGRVIGNIFAGDVHIEDGAYIKGSIDMQKQDVFKQYVASDLDEHHARNSVFGFIFKKDREVPHAETFLLPDLREETETSKEPAAFSVEDNFAKAAQHAKRSILGETMVIKGQLTTGEADEEGSEGSGSEGDIIILGHVDGVIYFKNACLGVGAHSEIHGNIFVKTLVHYGRLAGNIYADKVNVKKTGHVEGHIFSPRVSTEIGAVLMGSISMEQQDIDEIWKKQYGPATVIEDLPKENVQVLEEQADTSPSGLVSSGMQGKNAAWPIFYPRD